MFPIAFEVTFTGDGFDNKRALKRHMRLMLQAILFAWLQNFFDRHFERKAYTRYPGVYARREQDEFVPIAELSQQEINQPTRINGVPTAKRRDKRPNFKTGRMKRQLKSSARISGTAKVATLRMQGPAYTDIIKDGTPDKAHEITFISQAEAKKLRQLGRDFLVRSINADRSVRRVRIGAV